MPHKTTTFSGDDLQRMYRARFKGRLEYRHKVWKVLIRDYFQRHVREAIPRYREEQQRMKIYYIANARMPSEKAYGIQLAKMCEAFIEQGIEVELCIPRTLRSHISLKEFYSL